MVMNMMKKKKNTAGRLSEKTQNTFVDLHSQKDIEETDRKRNLFAIPEMSYCDYESV